MNLLPCGHISHSEAEEKRWAAPEFAAETQRQGKLFKNVVAGLKKKGPLSPGRYPPFPHTYETEKIFEVKQHFAFLRKRLPREKYLEQVSIYERELNDFLTSPPCRRDLKGVPLLPSQISGLLPAPNLPTPRTGGRHVSRTIHDRNFRIAELVKADNTHSSICLTLDKENWPVPMNWRNNRVQTWRQAYKNQRGSVHSLMSKAATKKG